MELDRYEANGDYMCNAVDSILQALANRTAIRVKIHQIDEDGNISNIVIYPIAPPMYDIELAYYKHRLHYSAIHGM